MNYVYSEYALGAVVYSIDDKNDAMRLRCVAGLKLSD